MESMGPLMAAAFRELFFQERPPRRPLLSRQAGRGDQNSRTPVYPSGFNPASISARRGSRNGGSASFSPSVSIGSSVAKPGPSVAISNRMPFGSRN
jgi:hypothetical protein